MTPRVPTAFRLVGGGAEHAGRLPFAVRDDADAVAVVLGADDATGIVAIARAVPEADALAPGTMVVVLPSVALGGSLATRVLAALGRGKIIPRAPRCGALLARGYVRIGALVDPATKLDLAFGFVPARGNDADADPDEATGPC